MSISDAQYRRWLERSAKAPRCALFELTFLGADPDSSLVSGEHKVYISNMPYITGGDDDPAHQEFDYCVLEEPSFTRRMGEQLEGRSTQSYGELIISNECTLGDDGQLLEAGVREDWLSMNWDGRRIRMWLGDPGWAFPDFRLVLDGRIVDIFDPGGYKIGFRISDKAALLDRPLMTAVLDGDGPEAGQPMPLAYGHTLHNIRPRLIDRVDQVYRISTTEPGVEELWRSAFYFENPFRVRENGVPLAFDLYMTGTTIGTNTMTTAPMLHGFVENTRLRFYLSGGDALPAPLVVGTDYWVIAAGLTTTDFRVAATRGGSVIVLTMNQVGTPYIASTGWDADPANGTFQLAGNPAGTITCDCWGLAFGSGTPTQINTAGEVIEEALTSSLTNTPLTSGDIDAASLADFVALCPQKVGIYVTERMTFADLLDRMVLSVGGWWGFSRDGLLQFGRLDLPDSATVPVYSFVNDDVARRSMKMIRRILPRAEVKLRGHINWFPQDPTAGSLDSYERAFYAMPYEELTGNSSPTSWEDDPASHLGAARPEPMLTYLSNSTSSAETQTEADRRADLMQEPNMIFGFDTHQAVYLLKIGDPVEVEHPKYTGLAIVVGLTERIRGRSQVEVFCRKQAVHPETDIPEAGVP
ncbi:MAG TPA: hypothetical protein VJ501_05810 [Burkholderiaceae bacterium]|nr:hypothetical protein [Burkholderiaceae bacterium]